MKYDSPGESSREWGVFEFGFQFELVFELDFELDFELKYELVLELNFLFFFAIKGLEDFKKNCQVVKSRGRT